ncbi:heme-binding protein 1-like [Asterias rubens]|uniref:heme-binding protein 1-like n=1 Tax=Asterias rubens TaxID=7604 RepID=UPI001455B479|nr:heme-binding protein 1-like [Asterias rubens]
MFKTFATLLFTTPPAPKYTVIATKEGFEEREYDESLWAVTEATGETIKAATSVGFRKLFKYITGANKEGVTVAMTAPVMVFHEPGDEEGNWTSLKKDIKVGFMIPEEVREKVPTPTDDTITMRNTHKSRAYVSKYGGFSNEEDALAEIAKLRSALEKENCKYKEKFCYYCGYDSPVTLFGRRNEIWFIKETEVSTI